MSPADYRLGFVHRDGNMHDSQHFGLELDAALTALAEKREWTNPWNVHWYVYDADDPERGYFDPEGEAA